MQSEISEDSLIRFGAFEMALKSGELRKDGKLVKLQPQPFKVLALLAAHAGQLVTREEIQQEIWEGETFVDFEHGLNYCIKQVRAALRDNAQSPAYIETLPRRGYRFIATVEQINGTCLNPDAEKSRSDVNDGDDPEPAPVNIVPEMAGSERTTETLFSKSWVRYAAIFVLIVVASALAYSGWQRFVTRSIAPSGKVMLAVLPFDNLSANPEEDYFSDGLTEEMIAHLGRLQPQRLGVIARTSSMIYKGGNKDIRQIGHELGVDYVLEGSVRREGDKMRITAQLIRVSDQTHLWSETFDRNKLGVLSVQSDVAGRIARSLAFELLPSRNSDLLASSTNNPEAHDAYLKGRYIWNKGKIADLKQSIEYLERAIEKDPDYALAHAGLADAYNLLAHFHALPAREAFPKAKEAALRALELDDSLAEAHTSLGAVRFWFEWNWEEAEKEFRRAIELNPSYGRAHHDYAWYLVSLGRFDEGLTEINRALELDPLSPLANSDVGWVYLRARRYDEAIEHITRLLELEPDFGSARACLEEAYSHKGNYEGAYKTARQELANLADRPDIIAAVDRGNWEEAMRIVKRQRLDRRIETAKQRNMSSYGFASFYAALGEKDRAFEWLEKAFNERDPGLASIKVDPAWDPLRSDPRFNELLRRIGFPGS